MFRPDLECPRVRNDAWRSAVGLVLAASLGLVGTQAKAAPGGQAGEGAETPSADGASPAAKADSDPDTDPDPAAEGPAEAAEPSEGFEPSVGEVERGPAPTGGGVGGAIVDPDDPNAGRAQSDLEGESLATDIEGLPERLPKLQAAAWWTTFGGVALGTAGGVLAGIAEARQDQAERLAFGFDLNTGRATLYADVGSEYERLLDQGVLYQNLARGFIVAGGATLIAGIVLFAVDGSRRRKAERSASPAAGPSPAPDEAAPVEVEASVGGLRLRF